MTQAAVDLRQEGTANAVRCLAQDARKWADYMLGVHCGVTLAKIKAGSLVCAPAKDLAKLCLRLGEFSRRGIEFVPLRLCKGRAGILVYVKSALQDVLFKDDVKEFLRGLGYEYSTLEEAIAALRVKIARSKDFPHEIGIFLGYPPRDVRGFMERWQVKMVGYWRVYDDEEGARELFRRYDKCAGCICKRLLQGETLCKIFNIKEKSEAKK